MDTRARMHVEAYIKAYYFEEEEDLVAWIRENKVRGSLAFRQSRPL